MIQSDTVDLIVIATPHWQHADLAVAALRAGLHVVCEKPLTVTVSQADAVLQAAEASKGRLTVVFQSRFEPSYLRTKELLAAGELGPLFRCEMVETFWALCRLLPIRTVAGYLEGRGWRRAAESSATRS